MGIILFAILGAWVHAPAGFWITYGVLTGLKLIFACAETFTDK